MYTEAAIPPEDIRARRKGWIEVICGSMFSGKTEELIRRLNRARIAGKKVGVFKPAADIRYHAEEVVSHNRNSITSIPVSSSKEILERSKGFDTVGIDEAQFFDHGIVPICGEMAAQGIRVVVAGLDMDFAGRPFGPVPELLAVAEYITKVHAICMQCGDAASYSFRLAASAEQVLIGEKDLYEARCRSCFLNATV